MADVEDDAEFGSHFLDSMLEVEMTEEDNELDVSRNDDPLETLPPVPTFDLQSETLSYKDVYKSAIPQPVLASLPLGTSNTCNVPLVIKPSSMLIYSGGVATPQPAPVLASLQKIPAKSVIKTPAKNPVISPKSTIIPSKTPTVTTKNPIITAKSPIITTKSPIITTKNPIITTKNPIIRTKNPIITSKNPIITTKNPIITTKNPIITTKNPITTTKKPVITTKSPNFPTKAQLKYVTFGNASSDIRLIRKKFVEEVFRKEFVKNVFVKADPPWDISLVREEEMKYYKACFKDVSKVENCRLHCTICDKHLGCGLAAEKKINVHTMLKVLTCKPCFEFYGDGNFPCDQGDNCEIYCRWCGQGGALICCSFCPRVFCKRCVKRNYGPFFLKRVEKASDWACFCCAQKPLWPHRAVCRALLEYIAKKKTDPGASPRDTTACCKAAGLIRKRGRKPLDKNKIATSETQTPEEKADPRANTPNSKSKIVMPLKTEKEHLVLKPAIQLKSNEKLKIPITSNGNSKSGVTSVFSPRSILAGNNIIRGFTSSSPAPKLISAFPAPHLIQSPVVHGETLITPPSRLLIPTKAPVTSTQNAPYVRVSLTHQAPNLDVNKIPTVKIPHEVQGLVLRLIFPDNKMHYVRLASDGTGCKASKDFPMPQFKEKGASFVEKNLAEAFKISKMLYEKLMRIKEKVNSRTKFTEESVFNSSVKKLHLEYEKTVELLKVIDRTLLESHEEWKNGSKNAVDVIDISDDETSAAKKSKPTRNSNATVKIKADGDSDVEIIDGDDVAVNGKTPSNTSNYKEKYRLRNSSESGKMPAIHTVVVRKRKRGRVRKYNKRPKTMMKIHNGQPEEEDPLRTEEAVPDEMTTERKCGLDSEEEKLEREEEVTKVKEEVNGGDASEVGIEGM